MKNEDLNNHWDTSPGCRRHVVGKANNVLVQRVLLNFKENILSKIDQFSVGKSIDWGCGGGILTKELKKFSNVTALDVSEDSLVECQKYAKPDCKLLIKDDFNELNLCEDYDMILCHELIWHLPSMEYFDLLLNFWFDKIKPKYIAFNIKTFTEGKFKEAKNYKKDYLQAFFVSDDVVVKKFKENNYKVLYENVVTNGRVPKTYFVMEKENE